MTVLFISSRPMPRCENITAVYDAYDGPKIFDRMYDRTSFILEHSNYDYDLVVTDELVRESKAPVIMIYHGAALGKTYLHQRENNPEEEILKKCSELVRYAITSSNSPEAIKATAIQCGVREDQVLPLGMPRMDKYMLGNSGYWLTTYLYAPTYRAFGDKSIPDIDLDKINKLLKPDERMIIKPHMITEGYPDVDRYEHIYCANKDDPSEAYVAECDVVITDYSSIMMDAHALGTPVVLFAKDKDTYLKEIGMCLPYPEGYASRFCDNEFDLVRLCRDAWKNGPRKEDIDCAELAVNMCDGQATERVVKLIHDILGGKR